MIRAEGQKGVELKKLGLEVTAMVRTPVQQKVQTEVCIVLLSGVIRQVSPVQLAIPRPQRQPPDDRATAHPPELRPL